LPFNLEEYFCSTPSSKKQKNIVIFARRHWMSFLGDILVSAMLIIVPLIILFFLHSKWPNLIQGRFVNVLAVFGSAYYLLLISSIFNAWISYYYDLYILTNDSIVDIVQNGFFNRKISQLSLTRVQDVSSKIDGIFPTMFSYGDVLVETAGERVENFLLHAVPNPQVFSAKVLELHDQLIERDGRRQDLMDGEGVLRRGKNPENMNNSSVLTKQSFEEASQNVESVNHCQIKESGEIKKDDLNLGGEVIL